MATKTKRASAYQVVTDRILAKLELGVVPWRKPWGGQAAIPRSAATKKTYRGINLFLLHCMQYEQPLWMTYKQASEHGGQVRRGEKATPVVFWKWLESEKDGKLSRFPLLRQYSVFNVEQVDNLPEKFTVVHVETFQHDPIESAQSIVDNCPAFNVEYGGIKACWRPSTNVISMPAPERFETRQHFYSTLFHELVHWTGPQLGRDMSTIADGNSYATEELVAEMGAAMLCGHAGILHATEDTSAAYIDGWRKRISSDPKLVVSAAGQAQRAVDLILGTKFDE